MSQSTPIWERRAQPGDYCRLLGNYLVEHEAPCPDGHATGTVTDVRTGETVIR